jgi:hypothetical protein
MYPEWAGSALCCGATVRRGWAAWSGEGGLGDLPDYVVARALVAGAAHLGAAHVLQVSHCGEGSKRASGESAPVPGRGTEGVRAACLCVGTRRDVNRVRSALPAAHGEMARDCRGQTRPHH